MTDRKLRAVLIDPYECKITDVEHNGDFRQIYEFIGADGFDAAYIHTDKGMACIFVDHIGLIRDPPIEAFFNIHGRELAGKGLMLGIERDDTSHSPLTADQVREMVVFKRLRVEGFVTTVQDNVEIFGRPGTRITQTPVMTELEMEDRDGTDAKG
jgi:hypothetical protein